LTLETVLIAAVIIGVVLLTVQGYRFRYGVGLVEDLPEVFSSFWRVAPYLSPILLTFLAAYGVVNADWTLGLIAGVLAAAAALALLLWVHSS
jgi:hypothetical protein